VRQLLIYIVAISVVVAAVQGIAESLWGVAAGSIAVVVSIYFVTVFDLRIASPQWSMLRRILPSVSVVDLAIYFLPFAYMIALISGWLPTEDDPMLGFIIALPLYFLCGVYLLVRFPHMRRGSGDDLSWMHSSNMTLQERLRRYLEASEKR
jgi:hypothetical protein